MSRSCQSGTFSKPTIAAARTIAGEAADTLGDLGVALVRHRRRAFHPLAERLLDLADLRAGEVADLEGEAFQRGRGQRQRREQRSMPVAGDHLRRERVRLEAEPLARDALDLGLELRIRADGAGELPDAVLFERPRDDGRALGRARRPSRRASSRT